MSISTDTDPLAEMNSIIQHLTRGKFSFLDPTAAEIQTLLPQAEEVLPTPQLIFLDDEDAEPLTGFPILITPRLKTLEEALEHYIEAEEEAQLALHNRQPFDSQSYAERWERYRAQLVKVLENVTRASYGGNHAALFWLHHSLAVSRAISTVPLRLRRRNLPREHGDVLKYQVFHKWIDRVENLHRDTVHRLAGEIDEDAKALMPELLARMRDNVLIFTEDDYVSPDLSEIGSYLQGYLQEDSRELRRRLTQLEEWHRENLESDTVLRSAVQHLLNGRTDGDSRHLLARSGYVTFLSHHATYHSSQLLDSRQIELWEKLLNDLKRFEILCVLRKMLVLLEAEGDELVCRDRSLNTTWVGGPSILRVSPATRPIDFTSSWVVDPVVQRYGLVYDITDFSAILSRLGKAQKNALEEAFRMTSSFQRRINRLASSLRLRLEKYLGDGAFYSGRNARHMLRAAIHLQRQYPEFVDRGFPFDSGLRIALNYGEYRLLPLARSSGRKGSRFEFFGHGLVELSRLSTGKKTEEIDDFKTYLVAQGYPEKVVNKFFAPMTSKSSELISKREEARRFFAYINQNGALINEGIVATEAFVSRLGSFDELYYVREDGRGYVVLHLEQEDGEPLRLGIRKLGVGKFKGIEALPVYEIVDGKTWLAESLKPIPIRELMQALERLFASTVTQKHRA